MNTRSRLFFLVATMAVVSLVVTGSVIYTLYQDGVADMTERLQKGAQNHARIIEVIMREHPAEPEKALPAIEQAHEQMLTSTQSTELLVVRRRGEQIEFLLAHRLGQHLELQPVPFEGPLGEAARQGLLGRSGTLVGLDYRGQRAIAGYEPIRGTDWAVVYKVDSDEVQAPFLRAALLGVLLDLGLVLLAAILFVRLSDPLVQRLEESEQHHRALFDQSFQLLWTLKPDGTVLEANRTALDTAGVIESAVCDRRIWNTRWWAGLVEEQKRLEWAVAEAAGGNLARLELEAHGFGKRALTLDISLKPVTNRRGKVVLLNAEARDISERKQAERELAERTAYLKALIENTPLGVVAHDAEGRVRLCNPAFERLFGHECENIQGKHLDGLISPETNATEAADITRQVVGGDSVQVTTRRRRRDGTLLDVRIYGVPLTVEGELLGGFGLYEDITERKRTEQERERLVVELQEALANIKTLSGLLPICASCKKIRDDQGYWSQIESYISAHSRAQFSHGICPECAKQLYPEHYQKMFPELYKEETPKD